MGTTSVEDEDAKCINSDKIDQNTYKTPPECTMQHLNFSYLFDTIIEKT